MKCKMAETTENLTQLKTSANSSLHENSTLTIELSYGISTLTYIFSFMSNPKYQKRCNWHDGLPSLSEFFQQ